MIFGRKKAEPARIEPARTEPEPLGVPPFEPDTRPAPASAATPPDADADVVAILAAVGVELPPATSRGEVAPGVPVWTVPVEPGYPAADLWQQIRAVHGRTGLWPLLTDDETWRRSGDDAQLAPPTAANGATFLMQKWTARIDYDDRLPRGEIPELEDYADFDWADALNGGGGDQSELALVAAPEGWLVPGLLQWSGAANVDYTGDDHASVLRRWAARWGVELVGLGGSTMTLRIRASPTTYPAALPAAVEVALYCSDTLNTWGPSIDALTATIVSPLWQLWWD